MKWACLWVLFGLEVHSKEYFAELTGLQFNHINGLTEEYYYPEIVGSGVAVFDFENDGDMDLYFVQSGGFENNNHVDELWINQLDMGKLGFKKSLELTKENTEYGIAVASADINKDGFIDLAISNLGGNFVLINQLGKSFNKILLSSTESSSFSASASFCDINNDGWLDLYVSNYVNWSRENNPVCYANSTQRDYCGPTAFKGQKDDFFLNDHGNLILSNTTMFPTINEAPGLGVVCRDFNNDGWKDFVVANDGSRNFY
ncbi:MAG: VCBS repeat-containing protein [Proteobacteria bacterium]|nr:VCBS repeat-containing protein [Pseudomonadota bacterium]